VEKPHSFSGLSEPLVGAHTESATTGGRAAAPVGALDLLEQFSDFSDEARTVSEGVATLFSVGQRIWEVIPEEEGFLTLAGFEQSGLSAAAVYEAMGYGLQGARALDGLARHLQAAAADPTPLAGRLLALEQNPRQLLLQVQDIRDKVLSTAGEISENFAMLLLHFFNTEGIRTRDSTIEERATAIASGNTSRKEGMEHLLLTVRDTRFRGIPAGNVGDLPAGEFFRLLAITYKDWRKMMQDRLPRQAPSDIVESPEITLSEPLPSEAGPAKSQEGADGLSAGVTALRQELTQLTDLYAQRAVSYRPSWTQLRKSFRELELAIRRHELLSPQDKNSDPTQVRRRIIGLMTVFAELGSPAPEPPEIIQADLQDPSHFLHLRKGGGRESQAGGNGFTDSGTGNKRR